MPDSIFNSAKIYAACLMRYRPRSRKELRDRLRRKGYGCQAITRVIRDFMDDGTIDDRRFAKYWAREIFQASPRSLSAIKRELILKGIGRHIADDVIDELRPGIDEEAVARGLLRKRLRRLKGVDRNRARRRLFGYLARRGFQSAIICKVLNEAY